MKAQISKHERERERGTIPIALDPEPGLGTVTMSDPKLTAAPAAYLYQLTALRPAADAGEVGAKMADPANLLRFGVISIRTGSTAVLHIDHRLNLLDHRHRWYQYRHRSRSRSRSWFRSLSPIRLRLRRRRRCSGGLRRDGAGSGLAWRGHRSPHRLLSNASPLVA